MAQRRYMNDARIVQAVGQMWTRIGVRTTVEAQPYSTFIGRATRREAPAALLTWGNSTGEISVFLNSVLRTPNRERGHGAANRTRYSNPGLDSLVAAAETEMDDAKREDLLRQATRLVVADLPMIPLYMQNALWAMRADLTYTARRMRERSHRDRPARGRDAPLPGACGPPRRRRADGAVSGGGRAPAPAATAPPTGVRVARRGWACRGLRGRRVFLGARMRAAFLPGPGASPPAPGRAQRWLSEAAPRHAAPPARRPPSPG